MFKMMSCYDDSENGNSSLDPLSGSENNEPISEFNIESMDPRIMEMLLGDLSELKKKWSK